MTKQYTLERASPRSSIAMFDTATDIYAPRRLRKNNGRQLERTRKENTCRQHDKYVSRWRCIECIKYEEFFFFFSLPFPLSHPPIQLEQCFSCLNYDPSRGLPTSSTHVANVNITKRRSKRSQTFAVLNFKSDFSKNVSDSNTLRIHPGIRADCSFFFFFDEKRFHPREWYICLLAISKHRVSLRFADFTLAERLYVRPRVCEHLHPLRARAPFNLLPTSILATSLLTQRGSK